MLEGCTPWAADVAERYRKAGYWQGVPLGDLLRRWAIRSGSRTALVYRDRRIGYAELDAWVDRMAAGLRAQGIQAGDRVVVQLPNVPEFLVVCFAMFRMGAIPVFSLMAHRSHEIGHLLTLSGATGYVVAGRHQGFDHTALAEEVAGGCPQLRRVFVADDLEPGRSAGRAQFVPLAEVTAEPEHLPAVDPADVAFFLLSGGTTALPKLIPRTHDDYAYQLDTTGRLDELTTDDVYLAVLPVEFNFTWGCPGVLGTLHSGGTVVLAEAADPDECFDTIQEERVTVTSLVPTIAQLWTESAEAQDFDGGSLRLLQIGGAPLHPDLAARIEPALGCRLQQVFGMAEGLLSMTRLDDPAEAVVRTQGRPISPADEIRIVDEGGDEVPPGHTGELLVRGPYTLQGYYRAPEHNARVFTADGFFRTGDLASRTDAGRLVIEGRLKDVIIRGGNKISAAELEGHLLRLPDVERAAVIGIPDDFLGERICAFVRPSGAAPTLPQLRRGLSAAGIADYKLPDRLEVVADLPLTGLGKVDKKALATAVASAPSRER